MTQPRENRSELLCPVAFSRHGAIDTRECDGPACAWWFNDRCAITALAAALEALFLYSSRPT